MPDLDLGQLTRGGEVHNLSGHERGVAARKFFKLDMLDRESDAVRVVVPEGLFTLTPSFFQGLFADSVKLLGGGPEFLTRYHFVASPLIMKQVMRGIESVARRRDL